MPKFPRVNSRIQFFTENIHFVLRDKAKIRLFLLHVIREENKKPWYINFIFCSDEYLLELNKTYLKHDTLTDIISFSFSDSPEVVSGDIYISIERVRENSGKYLEPFDKELLRVMIHGILHLVGYDDKTKTEKEIMRRKEDHYLQFS